MQVCRRDWLNGLWTLKSFRRFGGQDFRLVLLDDGSIGAPERARYRAHFPGIVMAAEAEVAERVERELRPVAGHIADLWHRGEYFTLPKVVDSSLLARNETILTLDPDVLFFLEPTELLDAVRQGLPGFALLNRRANARHHDGSFCLDLPQLREHWGIEFPLGFGIGLGALCPRRLDWRFVDEVFRREEIIFPLRFMIDQTITALAAARAGCQFLDPRRYAIDPVASLYGVVARHYYSQTRDLMYLEGIPALAAAGLTKRRP